MISSPQKVYAFRLISGQDLKQSLLSFAKENGLKAAYVITCVGSLKEAHLRLADQKMGTRWKQKMEIVSLVGTLFSDGTHLHISLADSTGVMIGGHLLDECIVHTTAEIVLGEALSFEFTREIDPSTGYLELKIGPRKG